MTRRPALAVLLAAALAAAGCTSLPGQDGGDDTGVSATPSDGLSISLRTAQSVFDPQDSLRLELLLENTGEQSATVTDLSWGGAQFLTVGGCSQDRGVGAIPTLAPVDTDAGTAGDSISILRTCPYPGGIGLDRGSTDTFPATATVSYEYTGVASTSVTIVPDDAASGRAGVTTTAGPVQVRMTVPSETTPPDDGSLRIPVTVTNVGDGEVTSQVSMSASPGALSCPDTVTLIDGSRSVSCTLSISDVTVERSERLRLDLGYDYRETVETPVRLSG